MTFEELLKAVSKSTIQEIVSSGTDKMGHCLSLGCTFFEQYPHADQMTAMACMVGMILGTLEGEKLASEQNLGVIITHKERLELFNAQALAVFRESMAARGMPSDTIPDLGTLPPPPKGHTIGQRTSGRVLNIISGKRKRKPT